MRTIILDCDIASSLAKVDRLDLLERAFPDSNIFITESVYIELSRAKQAGFSFPDKIFKAMPIISLDQKEREMIHEVSQDRSIHFGESE